MSCYAQLTASQIGMQSVRGEMSGGFRGAICQIMSVVVEEVTLWGESYWGSGMSAVHTVLQIQHLPLKELNRCITCCITIHHFTPLPLAKCSWIEVSN